MVDTFGYYCNSFNGSRCYYSIFNHQYIRRLEWLEENKFIWILFSTNNNNDNDNNNDNNNDNDNDHDHDDNNNKHINNHHNN